MAEVYISPNPSSRWLAGLDLMTLFSPLTLFDIWKSVFQIDFHISRNFVFSPTFSFVPVNKIQLLSIRKWHLMCMRESGKGGELTRAGHTWLSPGLAKSQQLSDGTDLMKNGTI